MTLSNLEYYTIVGSYEKVEHDISLGRIAGRFRFRPISKFEKFPHGIST
jgi:predicted Mrr-cat superfamily restriction endonuclease